MQRSPVKVGRVRRPLRVLVVASCLALGLFGPGPARGQSGDGGADAGAQAQTEATGDSGANGASENGTRLAELRAEAPPVPWWRRAMSAFGLVAMVGVAWLFSTRRWTIPWRVILWGLGLQLGFGLFVLKTPVGLALFRFLNDVVVRLLEFTNEGAEFVFGKYFSEQFTFALHVLPTIVFFSSLMAVLYHLGVMQRAVSGIAWLMRRTMGTSGSETLSAASNIFVGQTEAPLVVRPYVQTMTWSELMAIMVGGFATVAGGVMAAYVGMLKDHFPDIAGHLIAASVMSAPAALVVAKTMVPETETSQTAGEVKMRVERVDANVIEAAARGAGDGLKLALNVGAMLLAFIALVALVNHLIGLPVQWYNDMVGGQALEPWTLQQILGYVFWPLSFLMGVAPEDCGAVGSLLGEKIVLNEFVAYKELAGKLTGGEQLRPRSLIIATYALCGFANFSSIAIQIGGIGSIAPDRRSDLARLGLRAMAGGVLAACMTASVAGLLV